MKKTEKSNKEQNEEKALLKFLKLTKEGKYASVEKSSLEFARAEEQTEYYELSEDVYYYSIT